MESSSNLQAIGLVARRLRRFAEAISQGHELGIAPGSFHEPWKIEFHQAALTVYTEALPWSYLLKLASAFEDCLARSVSVIGPGEYAEEWSLFQQYLRTYAETARGAAPQDVCPTPTQANEIEPVSPPILPFNKLSGLVSERGATRLKEVAAAVETFCDESLDLSPLTELEAQWLRQIVNGDRVLDIAESSGYSERSLYRALSDLWDRLGVDNRHEAVALATEKQWI